MEFPNTGLRCLFETCQQLDFLPFTCQYCNLVFCKQHFQTVAHACSHYKDNVAVEQTKVKNYCCSQEVCKQTSPVEMLCVKCKKHFCLTHRHHGCLDFSKEENMKNLTKWEKPKLNFAGAKETVEKEIATKLSRSKNSAMVNKVQLMRLKGRSIGHNGIPISERHYLLVYYPITSSSKNTSSSKGVFVSVKWTVGKVIDAISDLLGIANFNNTSNINKKLRLFHHSTGIEVAKTMDIHLTELLENGTLIDGQSVILEYSSNSEVDYNLYK